MSAGELQEHFNFLRGAPLAPHPRGTNAGLDKYSDPELKVYRARGATRGRRGPFAPPGDEFREHANFDKITLTAFQRYVKAKTKACGLAPALVPTLCVRACTRSTARVQLWNVFDADAGNYVDFGEFVTARPKLVSALLRHRASAEGVDTFFDAHATGPSLTPSGIRLMVEHAGLDPVVETDCRGFLTRMTGSPDTPASRKDFSESGRGGGWWRWVRSPRTTFASLAEA